MPHICIHRCELFEGWNKILAIRHPANDNCERCILQLWDVTSRLFTSRLPQICHRSHVASSSLFPLPLNFACKFLQNHFNPLPVNPFSIIEINQWQAVLKCCQKNTLPPSPSAAVSLAPDSNGSAPGSWTNVYCAETPPPILSSTC